MWRCKCDCGNETTTRQSSLSSGVCKSCGCKDLERRKKRGALNSAAPDLLAALEEGVALAGDDREWSWEDFGLWVKKARAALALAKGE